MAKANQLKTAIFAGGCFWCMEPVFHKIDGVAKTTSGYTGGDSTNPTYEEVCSGTSGHYEAIEIMYDPDKVNYETLLDAFFKNVDAVDSGGQFYDRGPQYQLAVFVRDKEEQQAAKATKDKFERQLKQPIAIKILEAKIFYPAEDYHQNYYKKNPLRYQLYRNGSKRDKRLDELWGGSSDD